jgi:hypothetical protein
MILVTKIIGDVLFFHYSGHGAQVKDTTGIEVDGMNKTILPSDYKRRQITDDELWGSIFYPLPNGVRLTVIVDCCQTSVDTINKYQAGGAMRQSFISAYEENPGATYVKLLSLIHKSL